ncbi:MAG: diacylglycerol kinase [Thiohalomonadales bacterium]
MAKPGNTGLRRIINAGGYSMLGLKAALRHEAAFRQECLLFFILTPMAFFVGDTPIEVILLISSLLMILIVELLNSGLEAVVDRIGSEQHELSGRAKDIGSAAVFVSLLLAGFVWLTLLLT